MSKKSFDSSKNIMGSTDPLSADFEFLSLFIEEAISGVDVARRYPSYYQKLLTIPGLRQAFLDIIQLMEDDQLQALDALPEGIRGSLQFLMEKKNGWKFEWMRSIEQLQKIFSPPQLVYRSISELGVEEEIRILQGEFFVNEFKYSVAIDCAVSEAPEAGLLIWLSTYRDDKVTDPNTPMEAILVWGDYEETLLITGGGRLLLPPVPFHSIFDSSLERIQSALILVIKSS